MQAITKSASASGAPAFLSRAVIPIGIPPSDEADLSWYFGPGAAYFERSTFGDQLRRSDNDAHESDTCAECNGFGFVELTAEEIMRRSKKIEAVKESIAERLRALEPHETEERNREQARLQDALEDLTKQTVCPACKGSRVEPKKLRRQSAELTVRPKPPQHEEPATEPEDWALCRYARVCRRVRDMSPAALNVLRLYYGDVGARWAGQREGRLLALYALTPPGKTLARRGVDKNAAEVLRGLGVRPDESIWSQAEAQRRKHDATRGKLLLEARDAAKKLLEWACAEWRAIR